MTIAADCELWLNNVRVPDTGADLPTGEPTALTNLVMQWGRENANNQPDTATCRFTMRDELGATSVLDSIHVGMPVEVYASGITAGAGGNPYYPNPGFGGLPFGPLATDRFMQTGGLVPAVVDATGGRAVQLSGNTAGPVDATNLLPNPRFIGDPLNGSPTPTQSQWLPARSTIVRDSTVKRHPDGPGSMKIVQNIDQAGVYCLTTSANGYRVPITQGQPFTGMLSVFPAVGSGGRWQIQVYEYDSANVLLTPVLGSDFVQCPENVWTDLAWNFTPKPNAVTVRFGPAANGADWATTGKTAWVCEPLLVMGTYAGPYFDGSTPVDSTHGHRWVGAVDASASERYPRQAEIWIPPLPFSSTIGAWDSLPKIQPGQTWDATITARVPAGSNAQLTARSYTGTTAASAEPVGILAVVSDPIEGDISQLVTITGTVTLPAERPAAVWIALGLSIQLPAGPTWVEPPDTWADHTETWASYSAAELYRLQATTKGESIRRVLVFSGSVTDAIVTAAHGTAIEAAVTAADITADLGSDIIGAAPWVAETVGARVARIVNDSKLKTPCNVDSSLRNYVLSWRDVDAQPVLDLLQDIAQSAGGVLWPATHETAGGYLWIEDPAQRASFRELAMVDGVVTVVVNGQPVPPGSDIVSACDILREPVVISQTINEVTTTVDASWRDQTLNDEGQPDPTERTYSITDTAALGTYGLRRLSVATELTKEVDAASLAQRILARSRNVAWKASGYTMDTAYLQDEISSVSNVDRMLAFMDLLDGTTRIGLPLKLVDLPPWIPEIASGVYVEGGSYTFDAGWWNLSLTISPGAASGVSAKWSELDPAWRWNQWDPAISWADLEGVAP